jgi:uncharacterized cofD-like protein
MIRQWLFQITVGIVLINIAVAQILWIIFGGEEWPDILQTLTLAFIPASIRALVILLAGTGLLAWGIYNFNKSLLGPLIFPRSLGEWFTHMQADRQLRQGIKVVAIGGGTGLPSALRAIKTETSNITAVVTVADDGGSSGRLRRDLGVQPPGDLRRNITALARDEDLMTQLFDFRFAAGDLDGHSFGNIFLAALVGIMGGMDEATQAAGRVLAIQGRVLPCTLDDVTLAANMHHLQSGETKRVEGESNIPQLGWNIDQVFLEPANAHPLAEVITAILQANMIIIGPGSLYTSLIPNLLVDGVCKAIRQSAATTVYVCNIATQPGETDGYAAIDHIQAIEDHVGNGLIDVMIVNNHFPTENAGPNTIYVKAPPPTHPIRQVYHLIDDDLTDNERPWRHDPEKLRALLLRI